MLGSVPIPGIDVWAGFIEAWWKVASWAEAGRRYDYALGARARGHGIAAGGLKPAADESDSWA